MPRPTSLLFMLILCIAGYTLLNKIHRTRYNLKRSGGYHTFLSSATAGAVLCGLSIIIYACVDFILRELNLSFSLGDIILNDVLKCESDTNSVIIFDLATITVLLSISIPLVLYRGSLEYQNRCFYEEFAQDSESPEFTQLFFKSLEFGLPILFTMSDRKVYIGYVPAIHAKPFNDIHIIPIFSGYRDEKKLTLVPVTPYQDILDDVENRESEDVNFEAFAVALPIREIVYAHLHDFEHYEKFIEAESKLENSKENLSKYKYSNYYSVY